jgi:hypothetical protein
MTVKGWELVPSQLQEIGPILLFHNLLILFISPPNERSFSVTFFNASKFCSASITTLLYSYLKLNDFSTI